LPKGTFVLEKLKEKTPKTSGGNYKYKFHQSLTPEIGRESLKKVIYTVEALASVSETKLEFLRLMEEKYHPQERLPYTELDAAIKEIDRVRVDFERKFKAFLSVPPPKKKKKNK